MDETAHPTADNAPKSPSLLWAHGLLRVLSVCAAPAAALGLIVLPGMRGNASEQSVILVERLSGTLAYGTFAFALALLLGAAYELSRVKEPRLGWRALAVVASGLVVALSLPALVMPLHAPVALGLGSVATFAAMMGALSALAKPHTRSVGAVMLGLALASVAHLAAWDLAVLAGDRASETLYAFAQHLATVAIALEGAAQIAAGIWLGSRGRFLSRALSNGAILGALAFAYWAAKGRNPATATPFESMLYASIGRAHGIPSPSALGPLAVFLAPCALFLGLAASLLPGQTPYVMAPLALVLVSRGMLDVPMRAMFMSVAACWLMLARADAHAMWSTLSRQRGSSSP